MRAFLVTALKVVGALLLGGLLVLALAAAGLWWWAGTPASLDWALRQVAKSQNLQAQGLTGSLRTGLNAQQLRWERDGLLVEAVDAQLAWQPLALWRTTLRLDHLRATRLRIEDRRPPRPPVALERLVLPLRVEIAELRIGQLQWVARDNSIEAGDIAARYSFDRARHRVEIVRLRWAGGSFSGEGTLGAERPMPVQARLQGRLAATVPGGAADVPLALTASVDGPLADMLVRAEILGLPDSPGANASAMATARVTPWSAQPLPQVQAEFQRLDAGAFWTQAPHTGLSGRARAQPGATGTWTINLEATNAIPGPWDQRRLPFEHLSAALEWHADGSARVRTLQARLGEGELSASGELQRGGSWTVNARLRELNPAAVYSGLAPVPLSGTAQLKGDRRGFAFEADLSAIGELPRGNERGEAAAGVASFELVLSGAGGCWSYGRLSLPALEVRTSDANLRGSAELQPLVRAGSGKLTLAAPGLALTVDGRISETAGAGRAQLASTSLPQAFAWLARLPGIPDAIGLSVADGRAEAQLAWQGGWRNPGVQLRVAAPQIEVQAGASAWTVRDLTASVDGRLSDAQVRLHARAEQGPRRASIGVAAQGGRRGSQENAPWQGRLTALDITASDPAVGNGPWTLKLQAPFDWRWSAGHFEGGAGRALLHAPRAAAPAQLVWNALRWSGGELHTAGRLQGLPLAWIELAGGAQLDGSAVMGDLVFDAEWDAALGATPRVRASLVRSRGDLTVQAETAQGQTARVAAGVREARLALEVNGEAVTLALRWDSERAGTAEGRIATRLAGAGAGGSMWQWQQDAPLAGTLRARLPRIGVWSLLAPPGWRLRGSLAADLTVAGTRADPQLSGTLAADDLALRSVVDGFEMQGGRLRASLGGQRVLIDEFILHGPGADGGTVTATGEATWTPSGPQLLMNAQATRLRASTRSDRQLTVSGTLAGRRDASGTIINGNLRVDQALLVLPEEGTPKLGADVAVRGLAAQAPRIPARAEESAARGEDKLQVAVEVNLGEDFRVRGMGIDTRLTGSLTVSGHALASPRLEGTIRTRGGEYKAYGQRLEIESGQIRFTGPIDNPVLDILAVRPNLPQQKVGVRVSGTVLAPRVQLYSDPDLPDAEKLAWLVTGRPSPEGGAESALLQEAALALLSKRTGASQTGIAGTFGLDELSVRREGTEGAAVTLGKRFGRNLYAAYERSLAGAMGTLSLFYDVTRRLTVRAQTGERTALDLIYTFTFD
jgi:translocation and assembly module TamB